MVEASALVAIGVITAPHGVRGLVRIKPFTEEPRAITAYGAPQNQEGRAFNITLKGVHKSEVLAEIEGVANRTEAEALQGEMLYIDRKTLPSLPSDSVYHADLIGLEVHDPKLGAVGSVLAVFDFGAGAMLEIERNNKTSLLVPFGEQNPLTIKDGIIALKIDPIWLEDN